MTGPRYTVARRVHHVSHHASTGVDLGDLASIITGVLTLAVIFLTYRSVGVARASADAAARSAQLADQQLREAQRPVLILGTPRVDELPAPPPVPDPDLTTRVGRTLAAQQAPRPAPIPDFLLPLDNIGVGPALNVYGTVSVRDTKPGILGPFALHVHPGIAASGSGVLRFNGYTVTSKKLLGAKITYTNAGGRSYTSEAHWDTLKKRFTSTRIKDGDTARVPVNLTVITPAPEVSRLRRALRWLRHPRGVEPRPAPDGGAPLKPGDIVIAPDSNDPKVVRRPDEH